jgi:hypothetical protein
MSGRTVFQFVLTGLLAAVFTRPGVAQFEPVGETPLPSPPEVLPMPREKSPAGAKVESSIVPTGGLVVRPPVVPPPPLCAFDWQLVPTPAVPATSPGHPGTCTLSDGIPPLPRNLAEIIGEFVERVDGNGYHFESFTNSRRFYIVRLKAPQNSPTPGTGQIPPFPVLGLTTIRWDELGGGWWVETIRVPQPLKTPNQPKQDEGHLYSVPLDLLTEVQQQTVQVPIIPGVGNSDTPQVRAREDQACCKQHATSSEPPQCCSAANKLAGTWMREMDGYRIVATLSGDELKIVASQNVEGAILSYTLIADCTLTKEGLVHGVFSCVDGELKLDKNATGSTHADPGSVYAFIEPLMPQLLASAQALVDCPFSFRTRMTSAGLMISNLKIAFTSDDLKEAVPLICGMYKFSKDGNFPPLKARKTQVGIGETKCLPTGGVVGVSAGLIPAGCAPSPPVAQPMLPNLPPPAEHQQKNEPQATVTPMYVVPIVPDNGMNMDKKQLLWFSLGFFGGPDDASNNKTVSSVPAVPALGPAIVAQPELAPPRPANVPGPEFDLLVDAFGQMLHASQSPSCAISPAQVVPPCPVQPVHGMQPPCTIMPPVPVVAPIGNSAVGTWVRVIGPTVYVIRISQDHLTITAKSAAEVADDKTVTECNILTADYHLMRDGTTAVGLITSFDARFDGDLPEISDYASFVEGLSKLQKSLTDKPFAMSIRVYGDSLVIGNVRLPEMESVDFWSPMTILGGRYSAAGNKPLPTPKAARACPQPQGLMPQPLPAYNPGYPTGRFGPPIMQSAPPMCVPPGVWSVTPAPGFMDTMQMAPNCPNPFAAYPNPFYPAPVTGPLSGCGGMIPPQANMPPVLMPPSAQIPPTYVPPTAPLPAVDVQPPRPVMPPPPPIPQQSGQSFRITIPLRIEYSK